MTCMEPATGNIYDSNDTLIGYRDPATGVFTAESGTDWELISDHQLINGACVTIPAGSVPPSVGGDFTTEFTGEFL